MAVAFACPHLTAVAFQVYLGTVFGSSQLEVFVALLFVFANMILTFLQVGGRERRPGCGGEGGVQGQGGLEREAAREEEKVATATILSIGLLPCRPKRRRARSPLPPFSPTPASSCGALPSSRAR